MSHKTDMILLCCDLLCFMWKGFKNKNKKKRICCVHGAVRAQNKQDVSEPIVCVWSCHVKMSFIGYITDVWFDFYSDLHLAEGPHVFHRDSPPVFAVNGLTVRWPVCEGCGRITWRQSTELKSGEDSKSFFFDKYLVRFLVFSPVTIINPKVSGCQEPPW